ncbi:3400_t:CDS:1, partial [Gigaspora rosea]
NNNYMDNNSLIEAESSHKNSHINESDNLETSDSSQAESVVGNRSSLCPKSFVWKYFKKKKNSPFAK